MKTQHRELPQKLPAQFIFGESVALQGGIQARCRAGVMVVLDAFEQRLRVGIGGPR